jgi:hypothetical protein
MFEPPQGTVHFITLDNNGQPVDNTTITTLSILVSSDYVNGSCRTITINRVSGQISEAQSGCNL